MSQSFFGIQQILKKTQAQLFQRRKSEESALQLQLALDGRHAPSCALQLRAKMINKSKQNTAREVGFYHLSARVCGRQEFRFMS